MNDLAPDDLAESIQWLGTTYRTILPSAASRGAISIVASRCPALSGPPRHVHAREDETFVVLEGGVEFWLAGRTLLCAPGQAMFIPRGTEHTFRTVSEAHMLAVLTPGGFERFFTEMAQGAFRIPEDMATITQTAVRHNLTFTGPPL